MVKHEEVDPSAMVSDRSPSEQMYSITTEKEKKNFSLLKIQLKN
jgi:hypothetical protein